MKCLYCGTVGPRPPAVPTNCCAGALLEGIAFRCLTALAVIAEDGSEASSYARKVDDRERRRLADVIERQRAPHRAKEGQTP